MSESHSTLTQARLRELLSYDPESGNFFWLEKTATHTIIGARAGGVDSRGYWRIRIFGKPYAAHRLAWLYVHGEWPQQDIDHISRNRTENRIQNLRDVSRSMNVQNTERAPGSSGFRGVRRLKSGKYEARITENGVRRTVGYYATPEEAHTAALVARDRDSSP